MDVAWDCIPKKSKTTNTHSVYTVFVCLHNHRLQQQLKVRPFHVMIQKQNFLFLIRHYNPVINRIVLL
jgi:hypothetical protein